MDEIVVAAIAFLFLNLFVFITNAISNSYTHPYYRLSFMKLIYLTNDQMGAKSLFVTIIVLFSGNVIDVLDPFGITKKLPEDFSFIFFIVLTYMLITHCVIGYLYFRDVSGSDNLRVAINGYADLNKLIANIYCIGIITAIMVSKI